MARTTDGLSESYQVDAEYDVPETAEESIADDRAGLRPAEVVQRNLLRLLPAAPVPVSCLHTRRDVRR